MKKLFLSLAILLSLVLIVSALADNGRGNDDENECVTDSDCDNGFCDDGECEDIDEDDDNNSLGNGRGNGNGADSEDDTDTPKNKTKPANGNSQNMGSQKELRLNCTSTSNDTRANCRNERQNQIMADLGCDSNSTKQDCLSERKEARWQNRIMELNQSCSSNDSSGCRKLLNTVKECKDETPGPERAECARNKLRLGNVSSQMAQCQGQSNSSACVGNLTQSVYEYASIKMLDLADRAEGLIAVGVSQSVVDGFVAFAQESVLAFNEASTIEEMKSIVLDVKKAWISLLAEAKKSI
jgi:hypothetical protein